MAINQIQADKLQSIQEKLTANGWNWTRCVTQNADGTVYQNAWLDVEFNGRVIATLSVDKQGYGEVKSSETSVLQSILRTYF